MPRSRAARTAAAARTARDWSDEDASEGGGKSEDDEEEVGRGLAADSRRRAGLQCWKARLRKRCVGPSSKWRSPRGNTGVNVCDIVTHEPDVLCL